MGHMTKCATQKHLYKSQYLARKKKNVWKVLLLSWDLGCSESMTVRYNDITLLTKTLSRWKTGTRKTNQLTDQKADYNKLGSIYSRPNRGELQLDPLFQNHSFRGILAKFDAGLLVLQSRSRWDGLRKLQYWHWAAHFPLSLFLTNYLSSHPHSPTLLCPNSYLKRWVISEIDFFNAWDVTFTHAQMYVDKLTPSVYLTFTLYNISVCALYMHMN